MQVGSLEDLVKDIRYGIRMLRRNPGFTAIAGLTLALGIGANTAMFSAVNAVLLQPLPFNDAERLVMLWTDDAQRNVHEQGTSFLNFADWRSQSLRFGDMAIFKDNPVTLTGGSDTEKALGELVSANLFELLGVKPAMGRTFSAEEEERHELVAVLSQGLWQRRFGGASDVIGKMLEVDGFNLQVIGVMPEGFYFPTKEVHFWEPATLLGLGLKARLAQRTWENRFNDTWRVIGRLKPGVGLREAQAEMTAIGQRLAEAYPTSDPDFAGFGVRVVPLLDQVTGKNFQLALWILLSAVGFVLLIACANVANLLLARGAAREKEFAIRAALGAGRLRLLRQLLTESATLSLGAGLLGLGLAAVGVEALTLSVRPGLPRLDEIRIDAGVLLFTLGVSLLSGVLFGLAPALRVYRSSPNAVLKGATLGSASGLRLHHTRGMLVVIECAIAVSLLAGSGLLIRSLWRLQSINPGFRPEGVLLVRVSQPLSMRSGPGIGDRTWNFYNSVRDRIAELPGVQTAGGIGDFLVRGNPHATITTENREPVVEGDEAVQVNSAPVTPDFFRAMGVPLLRGRFLSDQDRGVADSDWGAVVNETLARRFFPGEDPIGKRFKEGGPQARDTWFRVVGVVGDMRRQSMEREALPEFFVPSSGSAMDVAVRVNSAPLSLAPQVRQAIKSVDPMATVVNISTVESKMGELNSQRRFQTWLLGLFAALALVLSAIGIYGIIYYAVAQRTREIGIRMSVGARAADVIRLVVSQGMKLALIGVAAGLLAALWLTRIMEHLLFEVSPDDPGTFVGVAMILTGVALLACYLPARKAAQVNPTEALRYE